MNEADIIRILDLLKKSLTGCSVTQRIKQVKQPRGGYINPRTMEVIALKCDDILNPTENVAANLVGTSVDYLTRFVTGTAREEAFKISLIGAKFIKEETKAKALIENISGLGNESLRSAVKLAGFDVCYRAGNEWYRPVDEINPDDETLENIRIMVERSMMFFQSYGPKILDGFTFDGGYTDIVSSGDGDFTTKDTLWDFKVSKYIPKKEHTLQLIMYWRMGLHSIHSHEFTNIRYLGIYNPRLNCVYRIDVNTIPVDIISIVENEIIGYQKNK